MRRGYTPGRYARLVALKDAWDPGNLFRVNQNIRPSNEASIELPGSARRSDPAPGGSSHQATLAAGGASPTAGQDVPSSSGARQPPVRAARA